MESSVHRVNEEERKMLLLALGELARLKPDLDFYLSRLARKFHGLELYEAAKKASG